MSWKKRTHRLGERNVRETVRSSMRMAGRSVRTSILAAIGALPDSKWQTFNKSFCLQSLKFYDSRIKETKYYKFRHVWKNPIPRVPTKLRYYIAKTKLKPLRKVSKKWMLLKK
jgi:hypothetical protein